MTSAADPTSRGSRWVLDTAAVPPLEPPVLDAQQATVVAHSHGPLLVLAGPGTGKTTTIVESVVARLDPAGDEPLRADQVLVLTFGRKAADELRERIMRRLGGGEMPLVSTFHSFAFGLLRAYADVDEGLPTLLSGAEEDVRVRELLRGAIADGALDWPRDLAGAVDTLGLANEVRAVLARASELGMTPAQLREIGEQEQRPAWAALGTFAAQESEILGLQNAIDYAELLHRAVEIVETHTDAIRRRFRAVYVDELQDTDPVQLYLLELLADPSGLLVAVGDPDQSIYGFRGTDVGGLLSFRDRFRTHLREPAPVVVLGTTRRFGQAIRDAATRVLDPRGRLADPKAARAMLLPAKVEEQRAAYARRLRLPEEMAMLSAADIAAHRSPVCLSADPGTVEVRMYDSESARAAHIAHDIRSAHVRDGVPWSQLAVVVRTARHLPVVFRALLMAGVPASIARDEIPLRDEPAVGVMLAAAQAAADPASITESQAADLLLGPLCGLDSGQLREVGRQLRAAHRRADAVPPPSARLLRDLVAGDADMPGSLRPDIAHAVRRLLRVLDDAGAKVRANEPPAQVLWTLWTGGGQHAWAEWSWAGQLRAAALAGSRSASHDIDAMMALFDAAERAQSRGGGRYGLRVFVDALRQQLLPAEAVADRGVAPDAVRLLTAHRAKGLEWDAVWVVGAEEGEWPDLRQRGSVLQADRLTTDGVGEPLRPADLLAEERRLFYVALTRARHRVVVAGLAAREDADHQPSRFIADLCTASEGVPSGVASTSPAGAAAGVVVEPVHIPGWPRFAASLPGLVAQLRAVAADESARPALREAAVTRLARLATERTFDGRPLVPEADPDTWWGVLDLTPGAGPVRPLDRPIELSGSALDRLLACPLQWFLDREARASAPRAAATAFGSVVHAVAQVVARGDIPADLDAADAVVDQVWSDIHFDAGWQSRRERQEAREAIERFLAYHERADRKLVGAEEYVEASITVPTWSGEPQEVALRGFLDRIEIDADGRAVAIDLKNMRTPPRDDEIATHGQLGVYQLLLRETGRAVGGAGLVQLRVDAKGATTPEPKVQMQVSLPDDVKPTWIESELGEAALTIRDEVFEARANPSCRFCDYQAICPARRRGEQVIP